MKTYQDRGDSLCDDKGRWIPKDPGNSDYSVILAEIAKGEASLVAPAPIALPAAPVEDPTRDDVLADLCRALPTKDRTPAIAAFLDAVSDDAAPTSEGNV